MRHPLLLVLAAVSFPLLGPSVVSHAAGTAGQVCAGAKLKATAKAAGDSVTCHAKATQKGIGADPSCLAKAETKLIGAFAKAEAKGGCFTTGDASAIDALVDSSVGAFVAALRPVADANRCAAAKLKATGKKAKTKLGCHAKAAKQGGLVDPACLAKAEERFTAAFAKADGTPPCLTSGDAGAVEDSVDGLVDDAVAALAAATLPAVCGNGVIEGDEQCDGQANCVGCLLGVPLCCSAPGCFDEAAPPGEWGRLGATYFLNLCGRNGGTGYIGRTCEPFICPPEVPPEFCGTCEEAPFPTITVCCGQGATCFQQTVSTPSALLDVPCRLPPLGTDSIVIGTCFASGRCIPAS